MDQLSPLQAVRILGKENTSIDRRRILSAIGAIAAIPLLAACTLPEAPAVQMAVAVTGSTLANNAAPTSVTTPVPAPTSQSVEALAPVTDELGTPGKAKEFAQESIRLVNQARVEAGLEPLTENPVLSEVAQNYSERMATEDIYGHEDPQGKQVTDRLAEAAYLAQMSAENIAAGQPDPATVVEGWLNSPGHRANIMNPELREIGAGYAYTERPPYQHYWTHVFATPDASVGRDRTLYPAQALTEVNEVRQEAGVAPLTMDATLEQIAIIQLQALVQSGDYRNQVNSSLDQASREATQTYRQAIALSAAGPATPEEVVAQWAENNQDLLLDESLKAAGVAYMFVEQDEFRHYWLLLMAS